MVWDDYGPGRYQSAAICERGHVLTANADVHPPAKFCADCGAAVLLACPKCGEMLRGHYVPPGATGVGGKFDPPAYCFSCGQPFPWTAEKIEAAKGLADEVEHLSADDRAKLKTAIDDVASRGPRAELGAARIKKLIGNAAAGVGKAIYQIAIDVASEAAKKVLLGK